MLAPATKVLASKGSVLLSSKKPEKTGTSKKVLREIFHAALLAVDPYQAVNRHREETTSKISSSGAMPWQ
jgi:hypothetical protein